MLLVGAEAERASFPVPWAVSEWMGGEESTPISTLLGGALVGAEERVRLCTDYNRCGVFPLELLALRRPRDQKLQNSSPAATVFGDGPETGLIVSAN